MYKYRAYVLRELLEVRDNSGLEKQCDNTLLGREFDVYRDAHC